MKRLWYWILPGVGFLRWPKRGNVLDLISDIPYFLPAKLVPPMAALNGQLSKGIEDAGMSGGCKWKPFQLTPEEYAEFAGYLKSLGFVELQAPDWVRDEKTWSRWNAEVVYGIPASKTLPLMEEMDRLNAVQGKQRDSARINELWQEYARICDQYRTAPKIQRWDIAETRKK